MYMNEKLCCQPGKRDQSEEQVSLDTHPAVLLAVGARLVWDSACHNHTAQVTPTPEGQLKREGREMDKRDFILGCAGSAGGVLREHKHF